jgi:glycosyltransferase involved in cell wall biosynthesis
MAENYPALLQDVWDTRRKRPFDYVVRNPGAARLVEQYCLPRLTRILTVVEESRDRLVRIGVPAERIDVVSNTPSLSRLDFPTSQAAKSTEGPMEVVYLGLMEIARGVGLLVEAADRLRAAQIQVRMRLIGGGRDIALFREQAKRLGLLDREVEFTGFIPSHLDALALVAKANVGAIPHLPNEWANTTIPNKLFDYMAAGLPVLTSDAAPCARIVNQTGTGEVFHAPDVDDLVRAILRLLDPEARAAMRLAGIQAIRERFNWESDTAVLMRAIESTVLEYRQS